MEPFVGAKRLDGEPGGEVDALQIHPEDGVPLGLAGLVQGLHRTHDSGVVVQAVDPSVAVEDGAHRAFHRARIGNIAFDRQAVGSVWLPSRELFRF